MFRHLLLLGLVVTAACGNNDTKLKITSIEPEKGDAAGGTYVKFHGNRFTADGARTAKVYFGLGNNMTLGEVDRFVSDSEMVVHAPGGKAGETVDILVQFQPGGEIRLSKAYTFVDKSNATLDVNDLKTTK